MLQSEILREVTCERLMQLLKIDPTKNMRRFYELDIQPNLFGGHSVIRSWGRIGTKGQIKVELHDNEMLAEHSCKKVRLSKLNRGYKFSRSSLNSP